MDISSPCYRTDDMNNDRVITLNSVSLGYGRTTVLREVSLDVRKGDFIGVIGPNGSGKTTILRAMLGLLEPLSGDVYRDQSMVCGYVKQRQFLDALYPLTVEEIVLMGRYPKMGFWVRTGAQDRMRSRDALRVAGIEDLGGRLFRELSEGQKQRALIARALVSEPDMLLLDEPTNDLDIKGEEQIMRLLQKIHQESGQTIIMVSHLLNVVLNYATKILFLEGQETALYDIDTLCRNGVLEKVYGIPIAVTKANGKLMIIAGDDRGNTE